MKKETFQLLHEACKLAKALDIDVMALEDGPKGKMVRGQTSSTAPLFFIKNIDMPMDFTSVGIHDIKGFLQRCEFVAANEKAKIETIVDEKSNCIRRFTFKSGRTTYNYTAADANTTCQSPRNLRDQVAVKVTIPEEVKNEIQRAQRMLERPEKINITWDGNEVQIEITDALNDNFTHTYNAQVDMLNSSMTSFSFFYELKELMKVVNLAGEDGDIVIGVMQRGFLQIDVKGYHVFMVPVR